MINNARGSHVSPGVYMKEVDVTYSTKSIGQTTLGVAGETLKGPAFQPIKIENWAEFVDYFGETSSEKFPGSNGNEETYLKYELPYVAKSYLKESKQLEVCRVLGLSGYNAGPAWVLTVTVQDNSTKDASVTGEDGNESKEYAIAILRSKGKYSKMNGADFCDPVAGDSIEWDVESIEKDDYTGANWGATCGDGINYIKGSTNNDKLKLNVKITKSGETGVKSYPVSLRKTDRDYIMNVFGSDPLSGSTPIFVETMFDLGLSQLDEETITGASIKELVYADPESDKFLDFFDQLEGKVVGETDIEGKYGVLKEEKAYAWPLVKNEEGQYELKEDGETSIELIEGRKYKIGEKTYIYTIEQGQSKFSEVTIDDKKVTVLGDFSNYKSSFTSAATPWIVSELRGLGKEMDLKTLFRFHTISDGNAANEQIKVSIQNIDLETGTFDVFVRDFYDKDKSPVVLEKFVKCSMRPNSKDYIAFKIGTIDGTYELRSSYIMVEMNESEEVYGSIPCGFLGYPMMNLGDTIKPVSISYNKEVRNDRRAKEQYFGFSDITGYDLDTFIYKGVDAYKTDGEAVTLTNGFHLDERISKINDESELTLTLMGESTDLSFDTVTSAGTSNKPNPAIMISEKAAEGTIYEDKKMRKFTVCFYGGFDGWDIYRRQRTNTDEFRANKYEGVTFEKGKSNEYVDLPLVCNNSDYYAYLAGAREFSNPEAVDINILATPGINWRDHSALTQDIITMIEDQEEGRGGDALYVTSSPFMTDAETVVDALEDTGIDSSYAVTFWPWVKCYDASSQTYINLPVTKDVVRNMAYIDRTSYPWFAPAGLNRGSVDCVRATSVTRLSDEDKLYNGMINPVKTYAIDGVKIWGNKTIYKTDSPLNRVNVRRLMIRVKKLISTACRALIFEPNDSTVRSQFLSIVEPILDNVKSNRGIYEYKIEVDDSPEAIDAHTLPATIWIKPTPTLEYIDLTFVITPTGASFE